MKIACILHVLRKTALWQRIKQKNSVNLNNQSIFMIVSFFLKFIIFDARKTVRGQSQSAIYL